MARPTDYHLDPPDEPETTLTDDLVAVVDRLLDYVRRNGATNFQLEKAGDFFNQLRAIRDEMTADELPEYDDPIDAGVPIAAQQAEYEALVDITEEAL